jgi:hypothetical protein
VINPVGAPRSSSTAQTKLISDTGFKTLMKNIAVQTTPAARVDSSVAPAHQCNQRYNDPCEIQHQQKELLRLRIKDFSTERPFASYLLRPIVLHPPAPRPATFVPARSLHDTAPKAYIDELRWFICFLSFVAVDNFSVFF